ncbi:MAG: HTH domain-containing protein [Candidatus Hodarchaeota archaeon]
MKESIKGKTKTRKIEFEILEYINEKPNGVTITEISKNIGFSRNTISKYISILELKKKIVSKKIGAYRLYFSTKMKVLLKIFTEVYYKALLAGLKDEFPDAEETFKEIGRNSLEFIDNYLTSSNSEKLKGIKINLLLKLYYDVFGKFNSSLNRIQPIINLSKRRKEGTTKFILRHTDSEFLDNSNKFIYHYYIIAGLIEAIWKKKINRDAVCNVETIYVSDDKEHSYIEFSIEVEKR